MHSLLLLGSTGSIGTQTLDVLRERPGRFRVEGLAAKDSVERLAEQAREFRPRVVACADPQAAERLRPELPEGTALLAGPEAIVTLAREADYDRCVHGVVGAAGVRASLAVLERGKILALANKESLVVAGELLLAAAAEHGGVILPVDSEHNAVHQCLRGEDLGRVRRVLLTASGGPFRCTPAEQLERVTPREALCHPNWEMGPRITIGSATLLNKALEVIELHHLYGLERERIEVVIHPQSIVHSMVEFVDGSVIAQLGPPDMRGPIRYCLEWPDRAVSDASGFSFDLFRRLDFHEPDLERFPALELGFRCVEEGADAGCVLNAADEVACAAFLAGAIAFPQIARIDRSVLDRRPGLFGSLDALLEADARARELAEDEVATLRR